MFRWLLILSILLLAGELVSAENWPRWRGPDGNAVSSETNLPVRWSAAENIAWSVELPGEGVSSPIVWNDRLFLTTALDRGDRRRVLCLDRRDGRTIWTGEVKDENPEITSALTGYAAPTPATDGERVVAFFGNAGVVCYDMEGELLWRRDFGDFESELGFASSPVIDNGRVYVVCDHEGTRFKTFDSFLIALDAKTGETLWKTDRPKLFHSWSTPILVRPENGRAELIIHAQDELRAYNPATGSMLWRLPGMTGWVAPSPVFAEGLIFAACGRNGPLVAVRPGNSGEVAEEQTAWRHATGGPYVCSPVVYRGLLYVHDEAGLLTCYDAKSGERKYRERLAGKFTASSVAGDGKVYIPNEAGTTFVLAAGAEFRLLEQNSLGEEMLASPAVSNGRIYLRTRTRLYAVGDSK